MATAKQQPISFSLRSAAFIDQSPSFQSAFLFEPVHSDALCAGSTSAHASPPFDDHIQRCGGSISKPPPPLVNGILPRPPPPPAHPQKERRSAAAALLHHPTP